MFHFAALAVAAFAGTASAGTVVIEIEEDWRSTPDGVWNDVAIQSPGLFNVWVYADEPGVIVQSLRLSIDGRSSGLDASGSGRFSIADTGEVDPDGDFASLWIQDPGELDDDSLGISGISLAAFLPMPGSSSISIPVGPENALKMYSGVLGTAETSTSVLRAVDVFASDGATSHDWRGVSIIETPAPGSVSVILLSATLCGRRRR